MLLRHCLVLGALLATGLSARAQGLQPPPELPRQKPYVIKQIVVPPQETPAPQTWGSNLQRTALQRPMDARGPSDDLQEHSIQLDPPGKERLFRLESEGAFQERMRQEAMNRPTPERIAFPDEPVLTREAYAGRNFAPMTEVVEPSYVCYRRLFFEQTNLERYGWDLGVISPFVSAGTFFFDLALLPYRIGTDPCRCYECNSGMCQPGDPVPFLLYPPQASLTGVLFEAGTIVTLFAIFPG